MRTGVVDHGHEFLVAGPLLWLAVLAVNDAYDPAGDAGPTAPRRCG
ncbi:hypothetical protein [Microlunatus sp. GCM10028923]